MVYAKPFLRVRFEGNLGSIASETFSFGVNMGYDIGPQPAVVLDEETAEPLVTWYTTQSMIGSFAFLTTIKANVIDVTGRYAEEETRRLDLPAPYQSGPYTTPGPFQLAMAISFGTAAQRGLASKGRTYLPCPAYELEGPNKTLTATNQAAFLAAGVDLLDALQETFPGWDPVVVSNLRAGMQRRITHVRVGKVVDTIRSRRTSLEESYIEAAV